MIDASFAAYSRTLDELVRGRLQKMSHEAKSAYPGVP
jgi:hypothetical protein